MTQKFKVGDKVKLIKAPFGMVKALEPLIIGKTYTIYNCFITNDEIYVYELAEDDEITKEGKFLFNLFDMPATKLHPIKEDCLELVPVKTTTKTTFGFDEVIKNLSCKKNTEVIFFSRGKSKLKITSYNDGMHTFIITSNNNLYNPSYEDLFATDWHVAEVE